MEKLIHNKINELLKVMFAIPEGRLAAIQSDQNLFQESGIDSLEAFEAVIAIHELLGVEIPKEIDPSRLATLDSISTYLQEQYPPEVLDSFLQSDLAAIVQPNGMAADL